MVSPPPKRARAPANAPPVVRQPAFLTGGFVQEPVANRQPPNENSVRAPPTLNPPN